MKKNILLLLIISTISILKAQVTTNGQIDDLSEFSTRITVPFEMPDGTSLMSDVYLPVIRDSLVIRFNLDPIGEVSIKVFNENEQFIVYDTVNDQPAENKYQLPVLFTRTPYNKNTDTLLGQFLSFMGYAVVIQDMRGRYESEGVYLPMYSDGWEKNSYHPHIQHILDITSSDDIRNGNFHEDGYNSLKFINESLKRDYKGEEFLLSVGNIGTFGASAMGNSQFQMASVHKINPEEDGLKCMFPMVATNEHYHATGIQNGVFRESLVKGWISGQIYDGVQTNNIDTDNSINNSFHTLKDYNASNIEAIINDAIDHFVVNQYNGLTSGYYPNSPTRLDMDASFAPLNAQGEPDSNGAVSRYSNLEVPIYHLTGWWDIFINGQIDTYNNVMENISDNYENKRLQKLIIGPWAHQTIATTTTGDITYPDNVNDFIVDIDNIDDINMEDGGFEQIANSELYQWFRYNLNYHPFNTIGDPKVLIPKKEEWQIVNALIKAKVPSEDYTIGLLDFINFLGGKRNLPDVPVQIDLKGAITTDAITIPALPVPILNLENEINTSEVLEFKDIPNVRMYIVGNNNESTDYGNYWLSTDEFPLTEGISFKNMYLDNYNYLAENIPDGNDLQSTYIHDPNNPVWTLGGGNMLVKTPVNNRKSQGQINYNNPDYKPYVLDRNDIIYFTSSKILDSICIIGYPEVRLYASSEALDMEMDSLNVDFFVRILDVYPDGREYFVVEGAVNSMAREYAKQLVEGEENINIPFTNIQSGEIYVYTFKMLPIAYTFAKNHKIKVVISSSNHPRYQVNSSIPIKEGTFFRREPNDGKTYTIDGNSIEPFNVAQTIYHNAVYQSHIKLPVYGNTGFVDVHDELELNNLEKQFTIFPNPAKNYVSIISNTETQVRYTLFDIYGKTILKGKFEKRILLTTTIASGIYFIEIQAKNGKKEIKKLVVN